MTKPKTELEKKRTSKALTKKDKVANLSDLLKANEGKIQAGAPKFLNTEALIRVALSAVQKTPKLLECSPGSVLQACMDCATYGLVPNSMTQEAHLIPFKDTCQLVVGYKGLIKLAMNTGLVTAVDVEEVYENDQFDQRKGTQKDLIHVPTEGDPGDFRGAYAVIHYKSGPPSWKYVSAAQGEKHRNRFSKAAGKKDSPWNTNFEAMVMKTALRKALKYVPASPESESMSLAIAHDEMLEDKGVIDLDPLEREELPEPKSKSEKEDPPIDVTPNKKAEAPAEDVDPETGEIIPKEEDDPSAKKQVDPHGAGNPLFPDDLERPHD